MKNISGRRLTRREFAAGFAALGLSCARMPARAEETPKPPPSKQGPAPKPRAGNSGRPGEARPAQPAGAEKVWLTLPPTPRLPTSERSSVVLVNDVEIFYARFGQAQGPPVLLLHGGLGSSDYWGHQIPLLAEKFSVIAMDTRGHGRSPLTSRKFGYDVFAEDVAALLSNLGIPSVSIVGWSDGAITGLHLAMTRPALVSKLFTYGANSSLGGLKPRGARSPTFAAYAARTKQEYMHPEKWPELVGGLGAMWRSQPNYTERQLKSIACPTAISAGQYDEIIKPEHTAELSRQITNAPPIIQPDVSHFGMLQNPAQFNEILLKFLSSPKQ
jgi:pimeloyl-ACP methyl ester carboxylesterase